jgi:hypothetical protein
MADKATQFLDKTFLAGVADLQTLNKAGGSSFNRTIEKLIECTELLYEKNKALERRVAHLEAKLCTYH